MDYIAQINDVAQIGRGLSASLLGQSFDVYRLGASSDAGGIIGPGSLFASVVKGDFSREVSRKDVDTEMPGKALLSTGKIDMRSFIKGDVFVQRADSYKFENLVFTCTASRPIPQHPVFANTPLLAKITRPTTNVNSLDTGRVPMSAPIKDYELPLTLKAGSYAFAPSFAAAHLATPAAIPIGMVFERLHEYPRSEGAQIGLQDDTRRQIWTIFVPLLPGEALKPRDAVTNLATGDRFEVTGVMVVHTSFSGQFVEAQRLR